MTFLSPGTASHQLAPKTFLKEILVHLYLEPLKVRGLKLNLGFGFLVWPGAPIMRLVEKAGHTVRIPKSRVRAGMLLHILWI